MRATRFQQLQRQFENRFPRLRRAFGGQIMVPFALTLVAIMGLIGAGVDYSVLVVENARLQHALDAASLAGARALVSGPNPGSDAAQDSAETILGLQGYNSGNTSLSFAFSASPGSVFQDTIQIEAVRQQPTFFWRAIGINSNTLTRRATAAAGGGMIDVMLSLDLTGSMEQSGTEDLPALRQAVADFVDQMNPDSTQPMGAKVGLIRWAGVGCSWTRGNGNRSDNGGSWAPSVAGQRGDGDKYIDLDAHSSYGPNSYTEYVTPCYDDLTVLSPLSFDKNTLKKLATDLPSATSCPSGMLPYACPLKTFDWIPPQVYGTPVAGGPIGMQVNNSSTTWTKNTGTKIPNSITAVNPGDSFSESGYAWSTTNGGRNGTGGDGYARKVLVIMTDGYNEVSPTTNSPVSASGWDADLLNQADTLKAGPDGTLGTVDDVEIYTVGFFCTPYSTSTSIPQRWCKSRLAATSLPHPCPGTVVPSSPAPSSVDDMLIDASSSAPGTCTHYFPLKKTESLPELFRVVAGSITRGRLSD